MIDSANSELSGDLALLADLGFLHAKFYSSDHWAAVISIGSFGAIVDGNREALPFGYCNRWIYKDLGEATRAFRNWNGDDQPKGWTSACLSTIPTVWP